MRCNGVMAWIRLCGMFWYMLTKKKTSTFCQKMSKIWNIWQLRNFKNFLFFRNNFLELFVLELFFKCLNFKIIFVLRLHAKRSQKFEPFQFMWLKGTQRDSHPSTPKWIHLVVLFKCTLNRVTYVVVRKLWRALLLAGNVRTVAL